MKRSSRLIVMISVVVLMTVCVSGYVSTTSSESPPKWNAKEITVDEARCHIKMVFDVEAIPHYNELKVKLYSTNLTPFQVLQFFSNWTCEKGYNCVKVGMLFMDKEFGYLSTSYHSGDACVEYYGFTRGLCAVGIIIVSNGSENCLVVYTSGSIIYYYDILNYLKGMP